MGADGEKRFIMTKDLNQQPSKLNVRFVKTVRIFMQARNQRMRLESTCVQKQGCGGGGAEGAICPLCIRV